MAHRETATTTTAALAAISQPPPPNNNTTTASSTSSAAILPPPKPSRLRTVSSPITTIAATSDSSSTQSTTIQFKSAPVPLPRPALAVRKQEDKDTSTSLEKARTRLRSTGTSLEGLSPVATAATAPSLPLSPSVTTKPIAPQLPPPTHSNTSPVPPPKPKRASLQAPFQPPPPPPAPNTKPLILQYSPNNASASANISGNSHSIAAPTPSQQQPRESENPGLAQRGGGRRLPIVPRARKPLHLLQSTTTATSASVQIVPAGHRHQSPSGGGGTGAEEVGSVEGLHTETGVAATGAIVDVQTACLPLEQKQAHTPNSPSASSSLSFLLEGEVGHAHQRSHSGTRQTTTPPSSAAISLGRSLQLEKHIEPNGATNGHGSNNLLGATAVPAGLSVGNKHEDPFTAVPAAVDAGASATLVEARSRLRSATTQTTPPSSTVRSSPSSSLASAPTVVSSNTLTPSSRHVYPPPEQPSLHPEHYREPYLQQKWDLQEDEEDEAATAALALAAADRRRRAGRGGGGGAGGAGQDRRRVVIDTLEPSTPPSSSSLTANSSQSHPYHGANSPSSPSSSLTASLQKIQSMVHEQTERIRQVNYAEKKADLSEVVYEKSALWRVRGAEWGGFAKKAWEDRGGVGGIAGGLAERWRRRGDYPMAGGGYNPEGRTTGHVDQIFGIPLVDAVKHSQISPSTGVPAVVTRCIEYLDVMGVEDVGLYRVSGSSTAVAKMKALFDQGQDYDFLQKGHEPPNPHDVATLLKLYLRELPAPIIPVALLPAFTQAAASLSDPGSALREQLKKLPLENYLLLATLCQHLSTLADYEAITKMNMSNLGLIFCPTLQIGSTLFKQLLGGDDQKKSSPTWASANADEGGDESAPTDERSEVQQQHDESEKKALRERRLALVWADKEARHEEMENLELVKDFEMAMELQQDEEKHFQEEQQQQQQRKMQQLQRQKESDTTPREHHDHEWDRVDDFNDSLLDDTPSLSPAPAATVPTEPSPLIDLYDQMVMREIDEAASTPLITPPHTIRTAPPAPSAAWQQQRRSQHTREPAAVLDKNGIGSGMGRSLIVEGRGDYDNDDKDDRYNKAMSRSFHSGLDHHDQQGQQEERPRRSRPPPTFLAGVGGLSSPSSPPPTTASNYNNPSTTLADQNGSSRRANGVNHNASSPRSSASTSAVSSNNSHSNGISTNNNHHARSSNNRSFGGSPASSLSACASHPNPSVPSPSAPSSAAMFQDLFARPAQPTVSREDARGTKVKRVVNPFEMNMNMGNSNNSSNVTPAKVIATPSPSLHTQPVSALSMSPQPPPPLPPSASISLTPHLNEYVQQLRLHEEDNIRSSLDSSARHRRQPAGFERGVVTK